MSEFRVLSKQIIAPEIKRMDFLAPEIAVKARPGHFVLVMANPQSQRLALPIVDASLQKSSISIVFKEDSPSGKMLGALPIGDSLEALLGPLGNPQIDDVKGIVVCAGFELGIASVLSLCRHFHKSGHKVFGVIAATTRKTLILESAMRVACQSVFIATLDGSSGRKASLLEMVKDVCLGHTIARVYLAAPPQMMEALVAFCRERQMSSRVILQPMALSGIGFCGTDNVRVDKQETALAIQGPIFDGESVDFAYYQSKLERVIQ